jgi:inorganic pyrophosphatase
MRRAAVVLVALPVVWALVARSESPAASVKGEEVKGEQGAPTTLPVQATNQLARSLDAAMRHASHVWRDTPPFNADGTVNGYVEIARGDRRKWEFDMGANRRAVDRTMPPAVGGYPVNYGFVPQTVSYDGDPFDVLVLGPPIDGGRLVRGVIVGVMRMTDEKGLDSKVVISRTGAGGRPLHPLTAEEQQRIGDFFKRYKAHEEGKFSEVPGWGGADEGRSYVTTTHGFFTTCRGHAESTCTLSTAPMRSTAPSTR